MEFLPSVPEAKWVSGPRPLKRQSFPATMRSTHNWTFKIVDRRRATIWNHYYRSDDKITHSLPHMNSHSVHTGFVQILRADEEEEPVDDEEGDKEEPIFSASTLQSIWDGKRATAKLNQRM